MAAKKNPELDALIGKSVRVLPDLRDADGELHQWAGMECQVLTRNSKTGSFQLGFGQDVKVFKAGEFVPVLDTPAAAGRVDLVDVHPLMAVNSTYNPRRRKGLDLDSLQGLAANIKANGLLQPILVRPLPTHRVADTADMTPRPIYEVIAGERRWRACQLADLDSMQMLVREMGDKAAMEMALVENLEREDLDDMDEAEGFERLRTELGLTVEQIAARMGKGKGESYVRKSLKLCDLTPESREAMWPAEGKRYPILNRSTGLVVALYRPELQAEIVQFIAEHAGPGGEPASFRTIKPLIDRRFHLVLKEAPFDVTSAELVPAAGACTACPKRTSVQGAFFEDAAPGPESCTDADCFQGKREAHIVVLREQAHKDGFKVIDGEDALEARPSPHMKMMIGYVRLDDVLETVTGDDGIERQRTYGDALAALGKKAPKPRILIDPHTQQAVKVITSNIAEQLQPEEEEDDNQDRRPPTGEPLSAEEQALRNPHVVRAVLLRAFDAIRTGTRTAEELRLAVKVLILGQEGAEEAQKYLGFDGDSFPVSAVEGEQEAWIDGLQANELGQLLAMATLEISFGQYAGTSLSATKRVAWAEAYGIDVLAVRDKVAEDMERQANAPIVEEEPA